MTVGLLFVLMLTLSKVLSDETMLTLSKVLSDETMLTLSKVHEDTLKYLVSSQRMM